MCHIFPFAANASLEKLDKLSGISTAIKYWAARPRLLTGRLGASDRAWNMLCLSPLMHSWWGKGLWAFKCLGIYPDGEKSKIRLQFHWMPLAKASATALRVPWLEKINLAAGQGKEIAQDWKREMAQRNSEAAIDSTVAAFSLVTKRLIGSGHTFDISMEAEDAVKMKSMLDLQWASIQLATMSGAAGSPEFLVDSDDEDDDEDVGLVET